MSFAPGDVVILKSGGHTMTVVTIGEDDIDCLWTGDDGTLFRQPIPAIALTVVESAEAEEEDEDEDKDDEDEEDDDEDNDDEEKDEDEEHDKKRKKR